MSTARPSKPLARSVRQYADDLTSSVRAFADDFVQHQLEIHDDPDYGTGFQYTVVGVPFAASGSTLRLTAFQTILPKPDAEHSGEFSVTKYGYHLRSDDGEKLLRWELAPELNPGWPHVHFDAASADIAGKQANGHHVPTGRVLLEDVLRYLHQDCSVEGSEGYEAALDMSESWFDRASWGTARGLRNHRD